MAVLVAVFGLSELAAVLVAVRIQPLNQRQVQRESKT